MTELLRLVMRLILFVLILGYLIATDVLAFADGPDALETGLGVTCGDGCRKLWVILW